MSDKTKNKLTAEAMFNRMYDVYLNLDGLPPISQEAKYMTFNLMESYAKEEVKKACKAQSKVIAYRYFNEYGQVTTRKLRDKIVEFIKNTPSPE